MSVQPAPSARYRDADGATHQIVVRQTAAGAWQILDHGPAGARVIDTLDGPDDGRSQADAVARDYAAQQQPAPALRVRARRLAA